MKAKRYLLNRLIVTLQLISLCSCASMGLSKAVEENFRQVKVGQSKLEVESLIGMPNAETSSPTDHVGQKTSNEQIIRYQIIRADRRSYDPYKLIFKSGRLSEVIYDTQSARDQVELAQKRGNALQKCENMRPEIDQKNQKPDARPVPDSCEAAPPLK